MSQKSLLLIHKYELRQEYYKTLLLFYHTYSVGSSVRNYTSNLLYSFNINQRRRQLTVDFYTNIIRNYTTGMIAMRSGITVKHYKRTDTANSCVILYFQKRLDLSLMCLYAINFNNFNLRCWKFFQKLNTLAEPTIMYVVYSKGYNMIHSPEKRIKRRVLANLKKQ